MRQVVTVFVGADRSQALAARVLEHSISHRATIPVDVRPMIDLPVRRPRDPSNWPRTGFSFTRFCIPRLSGYQGRALYMDADMLVFGDIRELWEIPFNGAKVVIQSEVKFTSLTTNKAGAPRERRKQCSVMLLDCDRLDWDIDHIIDDLDRGLYTYEQLMYDLCILSEDEIRYAIPFEWNSLEYYDPTATRLLHYTDVYTQPWTSPRNSLAHLWLGEVRRMLRTGALSLDDIRRDISFGYLRPSLLWDILIGVSLPAFCRPLVNRIAQRYDAWRGYQPHREVYKLKHQRLAATQQRSQ
ncbi:MAG TPA: glycosyltransferase [Nitrospiraceae bacterium]|nr:glycosyltransferase [Nitrospiraceae bacterium]